MHESVDKCGAFCTLLTDLSKTFDCLPHELFKANLHAYSFDMKSLNLVNKYMSNRKQKVKVHRTYSSWQKIFYWVLQGSILRSLLFKICLCDLSSCTDNTTPYNVNLTQELVINKLEEKSSIIFKRFKKNCVKLSIQQTFDGLLDVLKRSSKHVLKRSSTRLQRNNFLSSKTS